MTKDVLALTPGDLVSLSPGRVERVFAPTDRCGGDSVIVHTDGRDYAATLPCGVQVEESR